MTGSNEVLSRRGESIWRVVVGGVGAKMEALLDITARCETLVGLMLLSAVADAEADAMTLCLSGEASETGVA